MPDKVKHLDAQKNRDVRGVTHRAAVTGESPSDRTP